MTYGRIPDIETIVVQTLNAAESIEDIAGSNKAATQLPPDADLPRLRVTLAGGTPVVRGWLHAPRITIEAWANDKETAFDLITEAAYVLENGLDGAQFPEGIVTSFTQETGLTWSPDPATKTPRYLAGFVAHIHPNN
jgi:hypothetical protein